MKEFTEQTEVLGYPIEAVTTVLDDGIHILLIGGCRTHVGAVSRAVPGTEPETVQYPAHREGIVSEMWAANIARICGCPVTVCCGIHYDNVSREEIRCIVQTAEKLMEKVIEKL